MALIGLFAVAALYVLSVGPAVLIYEKTSVLKNSPDLSKALERFYSPLDRFVSAKSPAGKAFRLYLKLCSGREFPEPTQ